jgi:uncharacterized protein YndB with AHSA1/START domain
MSSTTTETHEAESVITLTRVYDAPRELVWEAITEPRHVSRWWGGPGTTNPVCEMDVQPGGKWRHVMRFPDGRELHMSFVFVEVSKPSKLAWRTAGAESGGCASPPADGPGEILFTVTLDAPAANQTAWKLVARFQSPRDREIALSMGFTKPIEASNTRFAEYLQTLSGYEPQ